MTVETPTLGPKKDRISVRPPPSDLPSSEDSNSQVVQHPPVSESTSSIGQVSVSLFKLLIGKGKTSKASTSGSLSSEVSSISIFEYILFLINHAILLQIFFFLSIYKNFQFLYRRVVLKYLTLAYYPSKSPHLIRDDVTKLSKIPKHLSCILDLKDEDDENGGIDGLVNQISEISAWSISAGIPNLIIYEYNGLLIKNHQTYLPVLKRYLSKNLANYFGTDSIPSYSIRIPHKNILTHSPGADLASGQVDLEITLLSRVDGKPTIVELTKTMSELAINKELSVKDISIGLINEELIELVGPEPDLLISFGPYLDLQDYPPWHIRLTEIYWEQDNKDVNYAVFIRALQQFSNCKINIGK